MTEPAPQESLSSGQAFTPAEPLVTIYVVNAVRTSQGPGPGVKVLPASEAGQIVSMKYGVYGDRPPNEPNPEPTVRRFGSLPPPPRPAHSN